MSLFGDLDLDQAQDDPFAIPDNTYAAYVTSVKTGPTKAGDKIGMTIEYTISSGEHEGKVVREWKHIPQPADPKNPSDADLRSMSFLKQRLANFGITPDRMNSVQADDIIGTQVAVSVRTNNGYTNVKSVKRLEEDYSEDFASFE